MGQSFSDISLYHEYRSVKEKEHLVSQKTWDDLNLDDFFEWAARNSLPTRSCVQKSGRSCRNWIRRMLAPLHRCFPFPIPYIPAAFTVC